MITLKNIKTEINSVLEASFPGIEIYSNDIKEGFDRPSFFTDFDFTSRTDYSDCFNRTVAVIIYYFPQSRYDYKLDVLEKQDAIENIISKGFEVDGRHLHIRDDIESKVIDKVLQVTFEVEYYDSTDEAEEPLPKMEELIYKGDISQWDLIL